MHLLGLAIAHVSSQKQTLAVASITSTGLLQDDNESHWNLWWQDVGVSADKVIKLKPFQKINHWPGMNSLHTKNGLAATMRRMVKIFPEEYGNIHPQTWTLPEEWQDFKQQFDDAASGAGGDGAAVSPGPKGGKRGKKTYIVKPAASCQGRGIYLIRSLADVQDPRAASIAQRYIAKPFLIEGLKFDLRIYVLVSSVDPLRIWLFDEGLVRFATTPYVPPSSSNLSKVTQHLTNYAINKNSGNFVFNTGGVEDGSTGSKRTLTWFRSWLDQQGYSSALVWGRIADMINKVLIAGQPHLARAYRTAVGVGEQSSMKCFEVLGLDVLLDSKLEPWVLEVNHSPSLTCDTPLDTQIKYKLITETLQLMRLRAGDKRRSTAAEAEKAKQRLYKSTFVSNSSSTASNGGGRPGSGAGAAGQGAPLPKDTFAPPQPHDNSNDSDDSDDSDGESVRPGSVAAASSDGSNARPLHVRVTASAFQSFAAAIPADHALHEMRVANGYKLIFPPPDPALVDPSVWDANAAAQRRIDASRTPPKRKGAGADSFDGSPDSVASSPVTMAEAADGVARRLETTTDQSPPGTTSSIASDVKSFCPPPDIPIVQGVPAPFYRPWDTSRAACEQRIDRYRYYLAVSEEVYALQAAAAAVGGRKAADVALFSSAAVIGAAIKAMDGKLSSSAAGTDVVPSTATRGLGMPAHSLTSADAGLSAFARMLRTLAIAAAEKAATATAGGSGDAAGGAAAGDAASVASGGAGSMVGATRRLAAAATTAKSISRNGFNSTLRGTDDRSATGSGMDGTESRAEAVAKKVVAAFHQLQAKEHGGAAAAASDGGKAGDAKPATSKPKPVARQPSAASKLGSDGGSLADVEGAVNRIPSYLAPTAASAAASSTGAGSLRRARTAGGAAVNAALQQQNKLSLAPARAMIGDFDGPAAGGGLFRVDPLAPLPLTMTTMAYASGNGGSAYLSFSSHHHDGGGGGTPRNRPASAGARRPSTAGATAAGMAAHQISMANREALSARIASIGTSAAPIGRAASSASSYAPPSTAPLMTGRPGATLGAAASGAGSALPPRHPPPSRFDGSQQQNGLGNIIQTSSPRAATAAAGPPSIPVVSSRAISAAAGVGRAGAAPSASAQRGIQSSQGAPARPRALDPSPIAVRNYSNNNSGSITSIVNEEYTVLRPMIGTAGGNMMSIMKHDPSAGAFKQQAQQPQHRGHSPVPSKITAANARVASAAVAATTTSSTGPVAACLQHSRSQIKPFVKSSIIPGTSNSAGAGFEHALRAYAGDGRQDGNGGGAHGHGGTTDRWRREVAAALGDHGSSSIHLPNAQTFLKRMSSSASNGSMISAISTGHGGL